MAQQVELHIQEKSPYNLSPTSMNGVYLNPALPDDLDINAATQDELTKLGFLLPKPTKNSPQYMKNLWNRISSHKWESKNRIVPKFETHTGQTHNHKGTATKKTNNSYADTVWGGAGVNSGTWTGVAGVWVIPYVWEPSEAKGNEGFWNSSSWIGIDGMFTSDDVLQIGIQQKVDASGNPSYVAWYEWYAPWQPTSPPYIYQTDISNFPVAPGQTVYGIVEYINNNTAGYVFLYNETTNNYAAFTLQPPPGATFNASSCEWIMEAPDGGEPNSSLPAFTPVVFTNAVGWGPNASIVPQNCDTLTIENTSGKALTYTTTNYDTVVISFTG